MIIQVKVQELSSCKKKFLWSLTDRKKGLTDQKSQSAEF